MKKIALFIFISFSTLTLMGQSKIINKANKSQRTKLIKSIKTPSNKYLNQKQVERFFKKKQANYLLLETKRSKDFFYGAVEDDHVSSIDYIVKRDLEGGADYYVKKGETDLKKGNEHCTEQFKIAIALGSQDLRAFLGFAFYEYNSDKKKSIDYLKKTRQTGPKKLSSFWKRTYYKINAYDYFQRKDYPKAIDYAKRVLTINEMENTSDDYSTLGYLYQHLDTQTDYLQSVNYFEKALKEEPNDKASLFNLGYSLFKTNQFQRSLSPFKLVEKTSSSVKFNYPINDLSHYYLGVSYLKLRKYKEATNHLNLFVQKQRNHGFTGDAHYFLGLAYIEQGDEAKIRQAMVQSAHLGHPKAMNFAAKYLEGTEWYNNRLRREADEALAVLLLPLIGAMIDDSIEQFSRDMEGPSAAELDARGDAARESSQMRKN